VSALRLHVIVEAQLIAVAPIIAMFGDLTTDVPVYVSGALFMVAGAIVFVLPYESRGKASL
jgi:hypothetical protein